MTILYLTNALAFQKELLPQYLKDLGHKVIIWHDKINIELLSENKIDFIISDRYPIIIKEPVISAFHNRIINLHNSLLPYNRGDNPNFWATLESTPIGGTLHYIDNGVDTGDIIEQFEIEYNENETFHQTWLKLYHGLNTIFKQTWSSIESGVNSSFGQDHAKSTIHYKKDFEKVKHILTDGWNTKIKDARQLYHSHKQLLNA